MTRRFVPITEVAEVKITGKNRLAIWKAVSRGEFEVNNLKSVVAWCVRHATEEFKFELLPYVMLHSHAKNPAVGRKKSVGQ